MKTNWIFLLVLCCISVVQAQDNNSYNRSRELSAPSQEWHKIELPATIFQYLNDDWGDIRIKSNDEGENSIEVPYMWQPLVDEHQTVARPFTLINHTSDQDGVYFTFESEEQTTINEIVLNFKPRNFDWRVRLEGSQNLKDWKTIITDYRVVGLTNEHQAYNYSTLSFDKVKYQYFRLFVPSTEKNVLNTATLSLLEDNAIEKYEYEPSSIHINTADKVTIVEVNFADAVVVDELLVGVANASDYYRSIKIECLQDSMRTAKGWRYKYKMLQRSTLTSLHENRFDVAPTLAKKWRIHIANHDNLPLDIDNVYCKAQKRYLIARFDDKALSYKLFYENKAVNKPLYDIVNFQQKIPEELITLQLGQEAVIKDPQKEENNPLFEDKRWMWAAMVVIIAMLAYFSLKMMKNVAAN